MITRFRRPSVRIAAMVLVIALPAMAQDAIEPANFNTTIDNPWLPLTPGTVLTYQGTKDGRPAILVVTVTDRSKEIVGVPCLMVEELVSLAGAPIDRTIVYYAQDLAGNVWIFGEDVQELGATGAVVNTEGWRTGIDGAIPSLVMEATPTEAHTLVNAYTNDHSEVISLARAVNTPLGTYPDALETKEWTPDEPDIMVNKYYVQGIGLVRDVAVQGDPEEFLLVDVKK